MRVIRKTAIVGAALVALAVAGSGSALADPYAAPAGTDIVGVSSGALTPLFDGGVSTTHPGTFVTDYNNTAPVHKLWSWDATGSATITPKPGCLPVTRPNGSSAGIAALNADTTDGRGDYCIDFAQSSAPEAPAGNGLDLFASFARDAITWSSPAGSGSPVPSGLSTAQLAAIYSCTDTNWDQVGGLNAPIVPVLPQSGTDTRSTFLAGIGGGASNPLTPGSCVINGTYHGLPIKENTGTSTSSFANGALFGQASAVDDIFPYSIGNYIAQGSNEGSYDGRAIGGDATADYGRGPLNLHVFTDGCDCIAPPTVILNTNGYSNGTAINPSFPSELQSTLYNVVRNGGTASAPVFPSSPAYESTALPAIFGPSGWICTATTAKQDIASHGFQLLGDSCGALSTGS
jgi:ABC-type phosphate transport system substrate-binding protein